MESILIVGFMAMMETCMDSKYNLMCNLFWRMVLIVIEAELVLGL